MTPHPAPIARILDMRHWMTSRARVLQRGRRSAGCGVSPPPWRRRGILLVLTLAAAVTGANLALAADPAVLRQVAFRKANEAYRKEQFAQAIEGYRGILQEGIESGALYYNLGNALLKSDKKGEALAAYLKAKTLLPRDADLQSNLEYVQSFLSAGLNASIEAPRIVRWLTLGHRFATIELAFWSVLLLWITVACWVVYVWLPGSRPMLRPFAWPVSVAALVLFIALITQTVWIDAVPRAVAVRKQAEVKFSPQGTGTMHFTLPEGTIVRVLDRESGWVQVSRGDGLSGWAPEASVQSL